jgi:hypothetical protein
MRGERAGRSNPCDPVKETESLFYRFTGGDFSKKLIL